MLDFTVFGLLGRSALEPHASDTSVVGKSVVG